MGYCYCYRCKRPPATGGLPYTVLLFLLIIALFIALSKLLTFEAPEISINWWLLAVPIIILAVVHYLWSMDRRRKFCGPVPCGRCWSTRCYCC